MAYGHKYKPSKAARREFTEKMQEIETFIAENPIDASYSRDSYYFTVDGVHYRVSNHSIESSNAGAYDWKGEKIRGEYHAGGRRDDTVYIHAGKTRIIEIYTDIVNGYKLDGRGNRI